ncbi:MAG: hypothetical protein ACOC95_02035 [Planctomycetota bacterium]
MQLQIRGISFRRYLSLKKRLERLEGVERVSAEFHDSTAACALQANARAEAVAERLVEAVPELKIRDISQNRIKAELQADD